MHERAGHLDPDGPELRDIREELSFMDSATGLPPKPKQAYGDKKPPLHLVPPAAIAQCAVAMRLGAEKYGAFNWRENGVEEMTYIGAAMRHLGQYLDRDGIDAESGQSHLAHAMACIAILIDAKELGNRIDNRPLAGPITATLERLSK